MRAVGLALLLPLAAGGATGQPKLRGIAYAPFPTRAGQHVAAEQLMDDFMSPSAKLLWGPTGRGDLEIIRRLGANTVRLYGNDPREPHGEFMDEARSLGLGVIPGLSDFPYLQMVGSCLDTDFNCYSQVKSSYSQVLRNGWLTEAGAYHPAIRHVIVANEPDLKFKRPKEDMNPQAFCRAILSAVDAILDAEREANVTGPLVDLTATFSFAVCEACKRPRLEGPDKPAVNQMVELRYAMRQPEKYNYTPKNDLWDFYNTRFINSFNTANPSKEVPALFLETYRAEFPAVKVAIEEFHSVKNARNQTEDLMDMLQIVDSSDLVVGVSFFEYSVRYDKGGSEEAFGIFGYGDYLIAPLQFYGANYSVWCLEPRMDAVTNRTLASEIIEVYGGEGLDLQQLCVADPHKVPLDQAGFEQIRVQRSPIRMAAFIKRIVEHLGGEVTSLRGLDEFVKTADSFAEMLVALQEHPSWASWDYNAACVADRLSDRGSVGERVQDLCLRTWFNCENIPKQCKGSTWDAADYVFSVFYNQVNSTPLSSCYWNGSAIFAPTSYYQRKDSKCVVTRDPNTTPLTDEGYQAIVTQNDPAKTATFVHRVVTDTLSARVLDEAQLGDFADSPSKNLPPSMHDLLGILSGAQWVCSGETGRACDPHVDCTPGQDCPTASPDGDFALPWWKWAFLTVGVSVLCMVLLTVAYVLTVVVPQKRTLAAAHLAQARIP